MPQIRRVPLFALLPLSLALSLSACSEARRLLDVAPPPRTELPPAAILDLSSWMLTLPVDEQGSSDGEAATVKTDALLTGYASDWFYATADDGVSFWVPVTGARTANAEYPRAELREMLDPADASVNWHYTDTAELQASLAVHQAPQANGKVVIGQILGYNGDNPAISELAKLIFEYNANSGRASMYGLLMNHPVAGSTAQTLPLATDGFALHEVFDYRIRVADRQLTLRAGAHTASATIPDTWNGIGIFFRAGAMPQASGSSATDGALVTFYDLRVTHE